MDAVRHSPFGAFLDDLPKTLYVVAHVAFLGVGLWLWVRAGSTAFPHPNALLLYVASQAVFFAFFANWITMKMAVLVEQTLMAIMVCALVLGAL